ncbi:MAG: type II toxin-antitoxin system VapC family toxin [Acidobacteriia bacterium]|nr:type II toxin-antitoxin system VapC family toxin [Terriglobia bacterium]
MTGGSLLDTNILSETLRPIPSPKVVTWLESQSKDVQFVSVVTIGELRRGTALLPEGSKREKLEEFIDIEIPLWFGPRILPVTQSIAERWGVLEAMCQSHGTPVNTADGMIAATALEHGLTVVTRNVKDFSLSSVPLFRPVGNVSQR